jgi:hypothetical protein
VYAGGCKTKLKARRGKYVVLQALPPFDSSGRIRVPSLNLLLPDGSHDGAPSTEIGYLSRDSYMPLRNRASLKRRGIRKGQRPGSMRERRGGMFGPHRERPWRPTDVDNPEAYSSAEETKPTAGQ